jgi:hypothetical protein
MAARPARQGYNSVAKALASTASSDEARYGEPPDGPGGGDERARAEEETSQAKLDSARPRMSLLHHLAAVQTPIGVTVTLVDGTAHRAEVAEVYTDGLSVVIDRRRRYFPSRQSGKSWFTQRATGYVYEP